MTRDITATLQNSGGKNSQILGECKSATTSKVTVAAQYTPVVPFSKLKGVLCRNNRLLSCANRIKPAALAPKSQA